MKEEQKNNELIAPFYIGQKVIAVDAMPSSLIKNGQTYIVNSCEMDNRNTAKIWFWYVGVIGHHNRIRPSIFAAMHEGVIMSFEKMEQPIYAN